ncbi:hypothetical protein AAMO2058_000291800 [Amorphochlora amoebiformis]
MRVGWLLVGVISALASIRTTNRNPSISRSQTTLRSLPCSLRTSPRKFPVSRRRRLFVNAEQTKEPEVEPISEDELLRRLEQSNYKSKQKKKVRRAQGAKPAEKPRRRLKPGEMAPWEEGELFPEGWDEMDLGTKATNLYMGKRGFLFWVNKASLWVAGGVAVGWVVFRFVGPGLGLYKLANGFDPESISPY